MVEPQSSKLITRVRFPSPALFRGFRNRAAFAVFHWNSKVPRHFLHLLEHPQIITRRMALCKKVQNLLSWNLLSWETNASANNPATGPEPQTGSSRAPSAAESPSDADDLGAMPLLPAALGNACPRLFDDETDAGSDEQCRDVQHVHSDDES